LIQALRGATPASAVSPGAMLNLLANQPNTQAALDFVPTTFDQTGNIFNPSLLAYEPKTSKTQSSGGQTVAAGEGQGQIFVEPSESQDIVLPKKVQPVDLVDPVDSDPSLNFVDTYEPDTQGPATPDDVIDPENYVDQAPEELPHDPVVEPSEPTMGDWYDQGVMDGGVDTFEPVAPTESSEPATDPTFDNWVQPTPLVPSEPDQQSPDAGLIDAVTVADAIGIAPEVAQQIGITEDTTVAFAPVQEPQYDPASDMLIVPENVMQAGDPVGVFDDLLMMEGLA
jgi:hypothetical protein